jgi:hypothetical protein
MEATNFNNNFSDFYKNAVKMSFDAISAFTDQSEALTGKLLETIPSFPEEGKKVVSLYFKESQKGLAIVRKSVDSNLELDWTSKDAPVKSLEAMEAFSKDVIKEATEIQKEMKPLVEKATEQLPKELKELVESSNNAVNSGSENLQDSVTKGFETVKKTLVDVSAKGKKATK